MSSEKILSALESVSDEDFSDAIDMPAGKLEYLKGSGDEFKKKLIEFGLSIHPTPSWEFLSGRLFLHDHTKAVEEVKKYIKGDLDMSYV